jgi:GH25 family lysozyme M1 (1,4-beta-N-acetylmuramidase)
VLLLVDLSNNNAAAVDFAAMRKAGVYGVWHKVTEGGTFTDPFWKVRSLAARQAGLHVGGYHFARPEHGNAEAQARFFCAHLGAVARRDLHPVLDLEKNDAKLPPVALHLWAKTFLEHVHALTGVRALTYSYEAFIAGQKWSHPFGTGAGLWLAEYGPDDGEDHGVTVPPPWRRLAAHQFTSNGKVAGVPGLVDLSHARYRRRVLAHPWTS